MKSTSGVGIFSIVGRILKEFVKDKRTLVILLVLSLFAAGFDISIPVINQKLIDALIKSVVSGKPFTEWHLAAVALAVLSITLVGRSLVNAYGYRLFERATKLEDDFRDKGYEKYLNLDAFYYHSNSSGQVISRIERGGVGFYAIVHDIVGQNLVVPAIYFVAILAILTLKSPLIALIIFLPLPTYLFLVRGWSKEVYEIDRRAYDQFELASREQYDTAANVMAVKRFGQEDRELLSQRRIRIAAREIQYSAERLWNKMDMLQTCLAALGRAAVIITAGYLVITKEISIGEFTLFLSLQSMVYAPMFQLSVLFPRLRRNVARAERLFQVIDEPIRIFDPKKAIELAPLGRNILFERVWFRYRENTPMILKGIQVEIPKGAVTALVGRSGSGKSTFVNLLIRAYDPTTGRITFDGSDIRTVTQKSLRAQIAMVSQEIELFSRTIRENISYGRENATEEEIRQAAEMAFAEEFIDQLEKGYDAVVGERGLRLSGGQRQRIGIARAILRKPSVLILDEATNQLDTASEKMVHAAIDRVMRNQTSVIIAHRLSTVMHADQIIVLDHGNVEAIGGHEKLLQKSAIYKHLYDLQFAS
ncbi:MAG: ABC transporter ATP-binding protein [Patescibacteria group bacterium]